jgi:CheY-like chemotaxis protein
VGPMTDRVERSHLLLGSGAPRLRIFVAEDVPISRLRLSQVLRGAGYEVVLKPAGVALHDAVRSEPMPPALFFLPIVPDDPRSLETVYDLQAQGLTKGAPLLGVTALDGGALDFDTLRRAGICGVVDRRSVADDVVIRVNGLLRPPHERRRHLRATTRFEVAVTANAKTTREVATSIAMGGLGIHSARPVEVNTDLHVSFVLPETAGERIDADGRITHVREIDPSTWSFGMFFYPLSDRATELLHNEVVRLLALE